MEINTSPTTHTCTFRWRLHHFSHLQNHHMVTSPLLHCGNASWFILFYPKLRSKTSRHETYSRDITYDSANHEENEDTLGFFLKLEDSVLSSYTVVWEIYLESSESATDKHFYHKMIGILGPQNKGHKTEMGWDNFLPATIISSKECQEYSLLDNDTLVVNIKLQVSLRKELDKSEDVNNILVIRTLSQDLWQSYQKGEGDLVLRTGDSEFFRVHRFLLQIRVPLLAQVEHHSFREGQDACLTFPDITDQVLRSFVFFLYTDTVPCIEQEGMAESLLKFIHPYQMTSLLLYCERYLCHHMNTQNALELLFLADLYQCSNLKESAFSLVLQSASLYSQDYQKSTSNWSNLLRHPSLFQELCARALQVSPVSLSKS